MYYDVVTSLLQRPTETDGYHVAYYQKFTAVTSRTTAFSEDRKSDTSNRSVLHLCSSTRADDNAKPSSSAILPATCSFCNMHRKKKKDGTIELLGKNEELPVTDKIQAAAELFQDQVILSKVISGDLVSKKAKYHHLCKSAYLLRTGRISEADKGTDDTGTEKNNCHGKNP